LNLCRTFRFGALGNGIYISANWLKILSIRPAGPTSLLAALLPRSFHRAHSVYGTASQKPFSGSTDSLTWPAADGFLSVALISFYVPAIKSKESGTKGSINFITFLERELEPGHRWKPCHQLAINASSAGPQIICYTRNIQEFRVRFSVVLRMFLLLDKVVQ